MKKAYNLLWLAAAALLAGGILLALLMPCPERDDAHDDASERMRTDSAFPEAGFSAPDLDATASWNTYHGDAGLTGAVPASFRVPLEPYWRFVAGAEVYHTPVVSGGRVFFANANGEVFATSLRGEPVWSRRLTAGTLPDGEPREAVLDAPPACFGGLLFVCDADGFVFALVAETGEERWRTDIGAPVMGSPNWSGEPVPSLFVIAQDDGALHCLDAVTGDTRWVAEGVSRCDGSPGVGGGMVVFGSCASALHVFSAATGRLEREIAIEGESQVASGVAIDGSSAFSGCRSGQVLLAETKTGETLWSTPVTGHEIFTTPAVTDTRVVLGAEDGFVYGLRRTDGVQEWAYNTGAAPLSPVIAGDKVVVSAGGTLHVLELAGGAPLWSCDVSDAITAPAVAGPLVIVGCDDGTVAAFYGGGEARARHDG